MFSVARESPDLLYVRMTSMRSKDLIAQAYGVRPRGITGVLRRLGPQPRSPETYRMLVAAMEKGGFGAKLLMHVNEPSDALIETLATLPDTMSKHAIEALTRYRTIEPEDLALFVWTASRLEKSEGALVYFRLMQANDPLQALLDVLLRRQFPSPPWPGSDLLQPITSADGLLCLARHFGNCLRLLNGNGEILQVMNGMKYFYEWKGKEPAVLDLIRLAGVGWYVKDARGPKNADVSHATRLDIVKALAAAPDICAARLTVRANIYPCSHFWGEILRGTD